MLDMRAIHEANHGQYDRFSYGADTLSNDYLKSRGNHLDREKFRAWNKQSKNASVKSPAAPASSPSPSAKSPAAAAPKDGRRFKSAAPSQDGPVNFGRERGRYDLAGSGGVNLAGFDRPKIFAGKGTNQPSVTRADVPSGGRGAHSAQVVAGQMDAVRRAAGQADTHTDFRQLPAVQTRSPGAGGPQPRGGEPTGHQESLFHGPVSRPSPAPASPSPAAPEGWSARTGAGMVARSMEIASQRATNRPTPSAPSPAPSPSTPRPVSAPAPAPSPGWANRAGNSLVQKSQGISAKRAEFKSAASSHTNGNGQTRLF